MYPEIMISPMREELSQLGVEELRTADDVNQFVKRSGVSMVVVNSVCGCAAGRMRPAVRLALESAIRPDHVGSVFAGQDRAATEQARSYFQPHPPSSPSIAILRDGQMVHMMERSDIEHRDAHDIATELTKVFNEHCGSPVR